MNAEPKKTLEDPPTAKNLRLGGGPHINLFNVHDHVVIKPAKCSYILYSKYFCHLNKYGYKTSSSLLLNVCGPSLVSNLQPGGDVSQPYIHPAGGQIAGMFSLNQKLVHLDLIYTTISLFFFISW